MSAANTVVPPMEAIGDRDLTNEVRSRLLDLLARSLYKAHREWEIEHGLARHTEYARWGNDLSPATRDIYMAAARELLNETRRGSAPNPEAGTSLTGLESARDPREAL